MKEDDSFIRKMMRLRKAGLVPSDVLDPGDEGIMLPVSKRIEKLNAMLEKSRTRKPGYAMFFVMYDIENNRVRRIIAKYLEKKGCVRIQKSVYFADIKRRVYVEVRDTLKAVNDMYENNDSIFFIPVSEDNLDKLGVIGRNIDFEYMTRHVTTMFI